MEIEKLVEIIVNNGVGIGCLAYFIVRDYMFIRNIEKTLDEIKLRL